MANKGLVVRQAHHYIMPLTHDSDIDSSNLHNDRNNNRTTFVTAFHSWISNVREQLNQTNTLISSAFNRITRSSRRNERGTGENDENINTNENDSGSGDEESEERKEDSDDEGEDEDDEREGELKKQCSDLESGKFKSARSSMENNDTIHRFEYDPRTFIERLLVSIRVKNKLDSSRIVKIPFNAIYKYILLIILLVLTLFLTPQLLPRWLGFEWAAPQDLCQSPDRKLQLLEQIIRNETRLDESLSFLRRQQTLFECMNTSAIQYYHGRHKEPKRFLWPDECTSEIAQTSLQETHCHVQETNVCSAIGGFFGFLASLGGNCVKQTGPEICVESTNKGRADSLLQLEQQRARMNLINENNDLSNATSTSSSDDIQTKSEPILDTANNKIQLMVSRVMQQIDVAADAFILYSIIAIAVGVPLIIYRREKSSMVVSTTFGLTKMSFVVVFVLAISIIDSATMIVKETNFTRLFENFLKDPCYINPSFSKRRIQIISAICNEISSIQSESDIIVERMDLLYYDIRLFGYCKDDDRLLSPHPALITFNNTRLEYRNRSMNPGQCNITRLNELTSVPTENNSTDHKWRTLFGSGVIAQLLLKFILTSWMIHVFAYIHPMVLHNGKVEIWGPMNDDLKLPASEENAVKRFSRDKHLLSLLIFSLLMIVEIILILYAVITTVTGVHHLEGVEQPEPPVNLNETDELQCPTSFFG